MTVDEFDVQFDIFYNNIASNAAPSVDSYEKSVFLTQAQRDIVIELYSGRAIPGVSFESTEEARRYLKELITIKTFNNFDKEGKFLDKEEFTFEESDKVWFITMEEVTYYCDKCECINGYSPIVVPTRQDNLQRDLKNPFRGPSKERVLRVDIENNTLKLYSEYPIGSYKVWYIREPKPILLKDFSEDLKIEGEYTQSNCELNPILHRAILERAVALAKIAYIGKE